MATDEQVLKALCEAAGWVRDEHRASWRHGIFVYQDSPFKSRDTAHALLEALTGKLGTAYKDSVARFIWMSVGPEPRFLRILDPSAHQICRAMFAALPDCKVCGGTGKVPHCSIPEHGNKPCPACDGSEKAVK